MIYIYISEQDRRADAFMTAAQQFHGIIMSLKNSVLDEKECRGRISVTVFFQQISL